MLHLLQQPQPLVVRRRQPRPRPRELIGLGLSNVASALCGGFPSFGSLSRTPVNYITGASTRFAGVITALLVLLVVLFLTPLLRYMPKPVMAAIIIVAVSTMADYPYPYPYPYP